MTTTFTVRDREYQVDVLPAGKPEGEKFELYKVTVTGQKSGPVEGTLKLTALALDAARARAEKEGGSRDQVVARACGKSLASEVLIRELKPEFSFIVDHRWF